MVRGRCVMGAPETMLSERAARKLGLDVGSTVTVAYATFRNDIQRWVPAGNPADVSVVGVYRPADPQELYWGGHSFFPERERGDGGDPMFVGRRTLESIDHAIEYQGYDAIGRPGALTAETVDDVEAGYELTVENFDKLSGGGGQPDHDRVRAARTVGAHPRQHLRRRPARAAGGAAAGRPVLVRRVSRGRLRRGLAGARRSAWWRCAAPAAPAGGG